MIAIGPGITVLEASAGTGKTHTVTTVAVEAIALGLPLEQVLLVTFTRMATGELRDRVWRRLVTVEDQLAAHLDAGTVPADPLAVTLADGDPAEVARRHRHLRAAVADFDAATIATIHGFCQQVLSSVGFAGDVERDVDFLQDPRELTAQVVDDLLVQRLHRNADLQFPREEARQIADAVITNPHAVLLPDDAEGRTGPAMRVRFAERVRERLERRKRELRVITYDDLLTRLDGTLDGPSGPVVRQRLQDRFRLVVVDEFQDTDSVQWRILRRAFTGEGSPTRLVLVGDPKQAIYAFRGADVHAYLAARRAAGDERVSSLDISWRSDAGLLQALDAVFGDAALGHDEIRYRRTTGAPHLTEPRLVNGLRCQPMRIRQLRRDRDDGTPVALTPRSGHVKEPWARELIADDLAADVVRRLSDGSELIDRALDGTVREQRQVRPGDIAVLVSRNRDADLVRAALGRLGVPAVVNGAGSVFATEPAADWVTLLEAVEQPAARTRVRSAVLTAFFGWSADRVPVDDEDAWDRVHERLHEWRDVLTRRGVAAMFEQLSASESLPGRLLRRTGGERELTDLRHVMELLHGHATEHESGAATLVSWLRQRIREAGDDLEADEQRRRLHTDDEAVQVWTIHRSKGLEFPIVYLPYLWKEGWVPDDAPPVYHDEARGGRCIDVGGRRPGWFDTWKRYEAEQRGEELRLAYVAMTRAASQAVLWWAPSYGAWRSPLGRLLLQPHATGPLEETPSDDTTRTALDICAWQAGGHIAVEEAVGRGEVPYEPPSDDAGDLDVRRWDRTIDERWRRTSYSALTAAAYEETHAHGPPAAPEHDDRGIEDERMPEEAPPPGASGDDEARLRAVPSPFGEIGGGARFGTLVHGVLEHADFGAPDLEGELRRSLAEQYVGGAELDVDRLVTGLAAAISTPLGPLVGDMALRDIARPDRLDELHFELPLAGGDAPTGAVTMAALATVVEAHLEGDDPLVGYHEHLRGDAMADTFRGYLSGSIDVVLRAGGRFFVVDHKSNWLGVDGEELSAWHYRPEALATAMVRAHYPLQAMIYAVALHRYLRWRLPGYDPTTDLGGVLYLFLRGMCGPDTPQVDGVPCGVFAWRPPAPLVLALSDLFDTGAPGEAVA